MLHGFMSKKSHMGRLKHDVLGRLKIGSLTKENLKEDHKTSQIKQQNGKWTNTNEDITQAVAKAARVAIQTMAVADTARAETCHPE